MLRRLFFCHCLLFILTGCSSTNWGWHVISPTTDEGYNNLLFLLKGLYYSLSLSLVSIFFSVILGVILLLLRSSVRKYISYPCMVLIEIFRSIPMLVMVLWVYYGLPVTLGLQFSPFWAGVVALALCDGAFEAEIFRSGIQAVGEGQVRAAQSLGLKRWQTFRFVLFPQALRIILPALGNQYIYVLKMSSLASVIGVMELSRRANELVTITYRPLEIYSFLIFEYLALVLAVSYLIGRLEKSYKNRD